MMETFMTAIWRWSWSIAVLALWPLVIATYIETRTPLIADDHYRAVKAVAALDEIEQAERRRRWVICSYLWTCWRVGAQAGVLTIR